MYYINNKISIFMHSKSGASLLDVVLCFVQHIILKIPKHTELSFGIFLYAKCHFLK